MSKLKTRIFLIFACLLWGIFTGCPGKKQAEVKTPDVYRQGTWAGSIEADSCLVMREEPEYANRAWKIEVTVSLDEFTDGTLKGTATGNIYYWYFGDSLMHKYKEITSRRWDEYNELTLVLDGHIDDEGYVLDIQGMPISLPSQKSQGQVIDIYDFTFPKELKGSWVEDNNLISGESIVPQGEDYGKISAQSIYRESSVDYRWSIKRL